MSHRSLVLMLVLANLQRRPAVTTPSRSHPTPYHRHHLLTPRHNTLEQKRITWPDAWRGLAYNHRTLSKATPHLTYGGNLTMITQPPT